MIGNKELSKLDYVLATMIVVFFSCGYYNDSMYIEIISKGVDQSLMIFLMFVAAAIALFLLMRMKSCRTINTAISNGLIPVVTLIYIGYVGKYTFQIASSLILCLLAVLKANAELKRREGVEPRARVVAITKYAVRLYAVMGIVAYIFIQL